MGLDRRYFYYNLCIMHQKWFTLWLIVKIDKKQISKKYFYFYFIILSDKDNTQRKNHINVKVHAIDQERMDKCLVRVWGKKLQRDPKSFNRVKQTGRRCYEFIRWMLLRRQSRIFGLKSNLREHIGTCHHGSAPSSFRSTTSNSKVPTPPLSTVATEPNQLSNQV